MELAITDICKLPKSDIKYLAGTTYSTVELIATPLIDKGIMNKVVIKNFGSLDPDPGLNEAAKMAMYAYSVLKRLEKEEFIIRVLGFLTCFLNSRTERITKKIGILLEYAVNGDVRTFISKGEVDVNMKLKWMCQMALALKSIHKHNMVHCDIKCSNFLLMLAKFSLLGY